VTARYPQRVRQIIGITTTPKFIASEGWPALPKPSFKPMVKHALEAVSGLTLEISDSGCAMIYICFVSVVVTSLTVLPVVAEAEAGLVAVTDN
jgi:hypothetical protein